MKAINTTTIAIAAIAMIIGTTATSCKKKGTGGKPPKGETTLKIPCSGPDYFTDKKYLRSNSIGESMDLVTSKKKALANAKSELAASIHSTMKIVGDNFVESNEFNNKEELLEKFVENSRTVVKQELGGIKTMCEQMVKTKEGKFKTYVCIELPADDLLAAIHNRITKDEQIKVDFKYEEFKKTFEEEMDKFEGSRPY